MVKEVEILAPNQSLESNISALANSFSFDTEKKVILEITFDQLKGSTEEENMLCDEIMNKSESISFTPSSYTDPVLKQFPYGAVGYLNVGEKKIKAAFSYAFKMKNGSESLTGIFTFQNLKLFRTGGANINLSIKGQKASK